MTQGHGRRPVLSFHKDGSRYAYHPPPHPLPTCHLGPDSRPVCPAPNHYTHGHCHQDNRLQIPLLSKHPSAQAPKIACTSLSVHVQTFTVSTPPHTQPQIQTLLPENSHTCFFCLNFLIPATFSLLMPLSPSHRVLASWLTVPLLQQATLCSVIADTCIYHDVPINDHLIVGSKFLTSLQTPHGGSSSFIRLQYPAVSREPPEGPQVFLRY